METSPLSAADIAAVAKDDDFGGGWMWIIVLFLFMYGNGWNRGNRASHRGWALQRHELQQP